MDVHSQKQRFLLHELSLLSLTHALTTRDKAFPIYAPKASDAQKQKFKEQLRLQLDDILLIYNQKKIIEDEHIALIEDFAARISAEFGDVLHQNTFRFGVAQRLLNLHLKYLWAAGFLMREPPHCPIDNTLRDLANVSYNWVSNDAKNDYQAAIYQLKQQAHPMSLAMWELKQTQKTPKNVQAA
ncbi:hypothetical protein ACKLNO_00290 [Neisseriaceae bacterium B1]